MRGAQLVTKILGDPQVSGAAGTPRAELRKQIGALGIRLPASHEALLCASNGCTAFGGYFRVFSVERLCRWNEPSLWKFAWPEAVRRFLCFGETGWGDQYAYRLDDLKGDNPAHVYFLEALTLQPERLHDDFDTFMEKEFLGNAHRPYDSMLVAARERIGELSLDEHVQYVPSPLITGVEDPESVSRMPAVTAMTINGDLSRQLQGESFDRRVRNVDTYDDEMGRTRVRVNW